MYSIYAHKTPLHFDVKVQKLDDIIELAGVPVMMRPYTSIRFFIVTQELPDLTIAHTASHAGIALGKLVAGGGYRVEMLRWLLNQNVLITIRVFI